MNTSQLAILKKTAFWTGSIVLLIILLSFVFRNAIFSGYLDHKLLHFNRANQAELKIRQARIKGVSSLEMLGISLKPLKGDTLLTIDSSYASLNVWKLLIGRIALDNFLMKGFNLTMVRRDSLTNYMFLLEKSKNANEPADKRNISNYALRVERILEAAFDKVPSTMAIRRFDISHSTNNHHVGLHLDSFSIDDHKFNTEITVTEEQQQQQWKVSGDIDPGQRQARFLLYSDKGEKIILPFLKYKYKGELGFDTLQFNISEKEAASGITSVAGKAKIRGLVVDHRRISTEIVEFDQTGIDYTLNFGKDYLELDSSTRVVFNSLTFNPYIKYRPRPDKEISLSIHKPSFPAMELFSSLPKGLFDNLKGIRVKGELSFVLDFKAALANPDGLLFNCDLTPHHFSILSFGATDLQQMNLPFEYTAYEAGMPARTFMVGPENPNFRALDQIPLILRNCVLNSEDGAFYGHQGFLQDAFRDAIIANIKARRFVRGGSTITMQLVKNVFLNRNKTVVRKLEEMLIVWLIERGGLTSKDRMFEVYLNIIEWGPKVYGAQEAAKYYFDKDVSKLTYAEALFLSSIIPRPRYFTYSFGDKGAFRDYVISYYSLMSEKMLRKELISQEEFDKLVPYIELKGPAKNLMMPADTMVRDTTEN